MYLALRAIAALASALPERFLTPLARSLGWLCFVLCGYRRKVIADNLGVALPELKGSAKRELEREIHTHLALTFLEFLRLPSYARKGFDSIFTATGLEHHQAAKRAGRGILAVSGHLGSWELVVSAIARALPNDVVHVVVKSFPKGVQALVDRHRSAGGVRSISSKDSMSQILGALRRNEVVVIVLDQNATRHQGEFVPFFGKPACTMTGLAMLAMRTGAVVLPCAGHRRDDGRHVLEVFPPLSTERVGSRRETAIRITAEATQFLERQIRSHPAQWLWTHKRWRTQPEPRGC
ncbi:MAG: lysophospholipid acyltransferase family protein [Deltaproteobacteria bacterium]|nr:lysophospholipid acyltransferase family protein [Deltaproteobacteria bacterium]